MGKREIIFMETAAYSISSVAWYIESKGLEATAEQYIEDVYEFIFKLSDLRRIHTLCRDPERALLGFKCISFRKKYTVVFFETDEEITIHEFVPSKNIHW